MNLVSTLITLSLVLRCTGAADTPSPSVQPANFSGDDTPYQVKRSRTGPQDLGVSAFLWGYNGCKKNFGPEAKSKIDGAYYDAWVMSNTPGVASNIDWNNAAALEYLGAPGLNYHKQPQIQAVLANAAGLIYNRPNATQHYIKVRCDDPSNRCQNSPDRNPCQLNSGDKPKPTPIAYARAADRDDTAYPMINLCQSFFDRRGLEEAVTYGKGLGWPSDLQLSNYDNRASAFWHELLHLDPDANTPKNYPSIRDIQIDIRADNPNKSYIAMAYGPLMTKILARWPGRQDEGSTGYWVLRNADNLAYYTLAKYVTTRLRNVYPNYPIVLYTLNGPPRLPQPSLVAKFNKVNGSVVLNTTNDGPTFKPNQINSTGPPYPGCPDIPVDRSASDSDFAITLDDFAPDSAYPDHYHAQVSSWISELHDHVSATPTSAAPSPATSTAPPSPPPALETPPASLVRRLRPVNLASYQDSKT